MSNSEVNLVAKFHLRRNKFICAQINLPHDKAQINFSGYADKFWGHFVMFSGLIANNNKIRRYEYAKEQLQTIKNFAPVFFVFAKYHSLRVSVTSLVRILIPIVADNSVES